MFVTYVATRRTNQPPNKKPSYHREAARCSVSPTILLSHSWRRY